jgi:hypothetical protein
MNQHASKLGRLAKGKRKNFSPQYRRELKARLANARKIKQTKTNA